MILWTNAKNRMTEKKQNAIKTAKSVDVVVKMTIKLVNSAELTTECWLIQLYGLEYCKTCDFKGKKDCGGKYIVKTGMNTKGFAVPLEAEDKTEEKHEKENKSGTGNTNT